MQRKQNNKNVFKVATVRSVKLKAKAQKVVTNLKKLNLKENKTVKDRKDKREQIDQQLQELSKEVRQQIPKMKTNSAKQKRKKKTCNTTPIPTDVTTSMIEKIKI